MSNTVKNNRWNIDLWSVIGSIFFLGVFFIPFNQYSGPEFLGEMKNEAAAVFFLIVFVLVGFSAIYKRKLYIPYRNLIFQLVLFFFIWVVVSTILNGHNVLEYYFKQTSGMERFVRQFISLVLSGGVFFLTYYNIFRRYDPQRLFVKLRRVMFYSLIFASAYGFFEILVLKFRFGPAFTVLKYFDYFPFVDIAFDTRLNRISSITYEPPALATYVFTIAGWMFSYILTERGLKKYIPAILVLFLGVFSESRAGLVIIFVQVSLFFLLLIRRRRYHQVLLRILGVLVLLALTAGVIKGKAISDFVVEKVTSFGLNNDSHQLSNQSRFGLQYAMFKTFQDHPVSGVGWGQQTYVAKDYYPYWATRDNWEFRAYYLNEEYKSFPPGYNVYVRLLAETGVIGLLIFLTLLGIILYACWEIMQKKEDSAIIVMVIFITMVGIFFNWLKADSFKIFGFWINLAFLISIMQATGFKFRNRGKSPQIKQQG